MVSISFNFLSIYMYIDIYHKRVQRASTTPAAPAAILPAGASSSSSMPTRL